MMNFRFAIAMIGLPLFTASAFAHHSFAMYDRDKTDTVNGIVKEYEWTNPHVWIHIMAPDAAGKAIEWSFEMQSIAQDAAAGWRADSVKPGDKVSIDFHPLKDGTRGGQLVAATIANGQRLGPPLVGRDRNPGAGEQR